MASVALREVRERGFKDVSVCVVDDSGRTLVQKTMINCARLPPELAHAKAMLCVGMHASSRALRDKYAGVDGKAAKMPQLLAMQTVGAYAGQPLAPFPGGVLCRDSTGAPQPPPAPPPPPPHLPPAPHRHRRRRHRRRPWPL